MVATGESDLGRTLFKRATTSVQPSGSPDDKESPTGKLRTVAGKDFAILSALPVSLAVSWLVPEMLWPHIGRLFAPVAARVVAARNRATLDHIARLVGDRPMARTPSEILEQSIAGHVEEYLQVLREHRPGAWHPPMRLEGQEHLALALREGRGAVLWVGHFSFASLVAKKALHAAGISVAHLSHPSHGYSRTRLGMRFLNPIRAAVEARYVRDRVLLALDGSTAAVRDLRRRLKRNEVVSITVRERAQRPIMVPFLDGTIRLATGAPDLAYASKAPLLPVFTVRDPNGVYRVIIDRSIEIPRDLPRRDASEAVLRNYVDRLTPIVQAYPGQWRGWFHL